MRNLLLVAALSAFAVIAAARASPDEGEAASEGGGDALDLVQELETRAEEGDPCSARLLGMTYLFGKGVPRDPARALKWLRAAAEADDLVAQQTLGAFYEFGPGDSRDAAAAAYWYERMTSAARPLAEQGESTAQWLLARAYARGIGTLRRDEAAAAAWLKKAARQDHARAQYDLGLMYFQGRGVPESAAEAARWYRKAAEQDHPGAQNALGYLYQSGRGLPPDDEEAVAWFREAAEQGYYWAQANLGRMYLEGRGAAPNDVVAYEWFSLAARSDARGVTGAAEAREALAEKMTAEEIDEAEGLVREWRPTAAAGGGWLSDPASSCPRP